MIEIPKVKEEINVGERYFQIKAEDKSRGSTFFAHFCIEKGVTDNQVIFDTACNVWNDEMQRRESRYVPSIFIKPPKWLRSVDVIEQKRSITETKKGIQNDWRTLRGGLKFRLTLHSLTVTLKGRESTIQYCANKTYVFDKVL